MTTLHKIVHLLFAGFIMLVASQNALAQQGSMPKDPYENIRYKNAFDQEAIYKQYRNLMEKLGCAKNVFANESHDVVSAPALNNDVVIDIELNEYQPLLEEQAVNAQELARYEQACLDVLNSARRMALAQPAIYAITEMAIMGGGAGLTMAAVGSESLGGSFAGFAAIFDSLRLLRGTIQSGHNLISWPNNPLAGLEEHFAKNKCYIPRVLWPKLTNAFVSARQNEFARETHTNFINFALGFTTYKPKPTIRFKNNMSVDEVKNELNQRIENFFNDYKDQQDSKSLNYIKINVSKFIDSLLDNQAPAIIMQTPRYLYLHGSGGIGKTHFVQTLSGWIDELIPNSVRFDDLVINSADELEGTAERPGAFLKVLRNQLMQNKRGSVLIIDEATWLNEHGMVSPAKRIFNGDRSKLSTSYFGSGIDGTGISLEIPPMLIFVASNVKITDPALESRFDTVQYPAPNQEALIDHALSVAQNSVVLKQTKSIINTKLITDWVQNLEEAQRNFRYVAGNVEAFLLTKKDSRQSSASLLMEEKKEAEAQKQS